ncbi:phosphate-starvation-inducible PsiE family protein [Methylobacillus caricis]|uniref:phosphate-starvation-inducible PsiE family protein n=1 Tax=Methylobacillus caricis TaxID=1971611 RepID=UPI001D00045B|nr:phosphate-starvation-inducible PsiE family protein [Methylobacillus caricis]MCB5187082.1 phosphate-starvation-inducible PsiE family protein [Methylobacillus caricis]
MAQNHFPREFNVINRYTIRSMLWLNGFAHITIGLALAVSVMMFTWLFFLDVRTAFTANNLVHGFLNALGTLMLLWSISALISAEIRYLMGASLEVETFIEVAMVMVLRKLIIMPVQEIVPDPKEVLLWVGASLLLGLTFMLVRWGQKQRLD